MTESLFSITTEFSPIEHLVITHCLKLNQMNALLSYMPYLKIFDIAIFCSLYNYTDTFKNIHRFISSFWTEQQWVFERQRGFDRNDNDIFMYSVNPYR